MSWVTWRREHVEFLKKKGGGSFFFVFSPNGVIFWFYFLGFLFSFSSTFFEMVFCLKFGGFLVFFSIGF